MKRKQGIALLMALIVTVAVIWAAVSSMAEDRLATVWIMCKPGSYVSIREKPEEAAFRASLRDSAEDGGVQNHDGGVQDLDSREVVIRRLLP